MNPDQGVEPTLHATQPDTEPLPLTQTGPSATPLQTLSIRFTGSGSEYFRIWIVNLLLILVTFTLYWPFARARRIAYFQNNTVVGQDPLGFHANPWKMFRGYLVMLLLGGSYSLVNHTWPAWGWLALLAIAVVWPALWRASLVFRLRNSSWRGVRMAFVGDLRGAYACLLPLFIPAILLAVLAPNVSDGKAPNSAEMLRYGASAIVVTLVFLGLWPWLMARFKRYQHGGYVFASQRTQLNLGAGRFYGLWGKTSAVSLGPVVAVGLLIGLLTGLGFALGSNSVGKGAVAVLVFVAIAFLYLAVPLLSVPYATTRMQNMVWSNTHSVDLQFASNMPFKAYFEVNLSNWLLILITLGLFWPFAKVRATRMRVEAVSITVRGNLDDWVAAAKSQNQGVLGDAAGDFFGIDMGL